MNKLKMAAVQERLKLKRVQIDTWTTREKLCLASAVLRSGDQNWVSVSRTLRSFDELNRPPDWFSQKNCALQYSSLLEKVDTPKRKRGEKGEVHVETPSESIVRKLTSERVEELKKSIEYKRMLHRKLQDEIALVKSGQADDKLDEMLQEIEEEKSQKKKEAELHAQWLKEREEKLLEIKRAWRPPATSSSSTTSSHKQRDSEGGIRRSSSQSEQSSEPESLEDSPLSSEPMQVDVIGDESLEGQADAKPSSPVRESSPKPTSALLPSTTTTATPTSPLLTSLLKSPTQAPSSQASSILHSAITAQRGSSPTITSLLNSSPGIPVAGAGAVSPTVPVGIKSLVTSVICSSTSEDNAEKTQQPAPSTSPSAGAPTLSMLLELPPSLPGKPLPEIPSVTPKVPSTPTKEIPSSTLPVSPPPFPEVPTLQDDAHNQPESIAPVSKEEEKAPEDTTKDISSLEVKKEPEVCEEKVDNTVKVEEMNETVNDPEPNSEKSDAETTSPEDAPVVPEPLPVIEETKESSPVESDSRADETVDVSRTSPVTSEVLEETVEKSDTAGEAVEKKSTDAIKNDVTESLTEPPCSQSPDFVEVPVAIKPDLNESELNKEQPESPKPKEEVVCPDSVNKDEIKEKLPEEDIPKAINDSPAIEEENKSSAENVPEVSNAEFPPDSESAIEVQAKDAPDKSEEKIVSVSDKEDIPHPMHDEKLDEEASLPEPVSSAKKEASESQTAIEEDTEGSPSKESILSTPDTPSSDSQVRRRGGGRWRKSRGRSLAMYRFNQERMTKTKPDKEPETAGESGDNTEASAKDNPSLLPVLKEVDQGKEKSETKKVKSSEDEISNLKKEWDDSTNDAAVEEEKMEITSSQKKLKNKKSEEVSSVDNEQKNTAPKKTEASEVAVKDVKDKLKKDVEGDSNDTVVQELTELDTSKKADEKTVAVKEVEKQQTDAPVEKRHPEKISEKKKEEVVTTESPNPEKVTHEKRAEERRASTDKKANGKAKPVAIDKKVEEKKRLKESKPERKERKVDEKEEAVSKEESTKQTPKEEEKKGVVGKEKKTEGKERKSLLEKRTESGQDRKPSRERRLEEKEDKSSSAEKAIADKEKVKESDAKKSDSEKKISREKKSEERERKASLERKVEESKRKVVDEKKKEELVRSKSADRETVSVKKSSGTTTPEKSKIPASRPSISVSSSGRHKRKSGSLEDDDSSLEEPITQSESKKTKQQIEESTTAETVAETRISVDVDKKQNEETPNKRKMDKRRLTLSKRVAETEDNASRGATPMDEREKVTEGEANPKQSGGRKRGAGSVSVSSAPGTPLDQVPHSPASSGSVSEEERDYRAWKKAILLVWSRLATHKFASIFLRPITNDQAPGYHNVVFRPVDLYTIKKNVENGVIRTTAHFQRDVMLMFLNAIMYNASDHDVHRMSLQMQQESLQHIQILLEAQEAPKILRRETREGNKRSDSSSLMQMTPNPTQDELPVGAPMISTPTPAENAISNMSEEEMSECDYPLSYCLSAHKDSHCDDSSGKNLSTRVLPDQFHKDDYSDEIFKKNNKVEHERCIPQIDNNESAVDRPSSPENSNASDIDDDKMELCMRSSHAPKKRGTVKKKDRKQNSSYQSSDPYADDLGDDQLNYPQYGDLELSNHEMEKKQGLKRPLNDVSMSSDDSSSIPDDGGDWSTVMSIKEEKADDSESVSSSFYKRRRVQRKSTNSDPESLLDAPTFPFSSNFASLEESDYQAWKKFVLMVWDQIADHEFATIFMTPVRTDEAPRYYNVVFRPMDLGTIRKNVEKGVVRTISHFQRDVILMLTNAIMYNPSHHDVHQKTAQMQKECLQFLQMLVTESSDDPEVFRHEIRESNNKICSTGLEELLASSKSESQSDEDQITSNSTSGNLLSNTEKHSSLNGNDCEEGNGSSMQKSLSIGEKPTKILSKKRRTLDST